MPETLRVRVGAVTLVLVTLAAIIFSVINFEQRSRFESPDDGVSWLDSASGVVAWNVTVKFSRSAFWHPRRGPHFGGRWGADRAGGAGNSAAVEGWALEPGPLPTFTEWLGVYNAARHCSRGKAHFH